MRRTCQKKKKKRDQISPTPKSPKQRSSPAGGEAMAAAGQRHRIRVFVRVYDIKEGYFIYRLNLKHLFNGNDDDDEFPPQLRSFPRPVARFQRTETYQNLAFATSGTNFIVSASSERGTLFHDIDSGIASSGPDMHGIKCRPILLPVGDDMFFAMSGHTWRHDHPGTHYEALIRTGPPGAATGRRAWRALREPPVPTGPRRAICCEVGAYFVAGARVWISLQNQGTFSFDTVHRRWRKEGAWKLPVCGRAILVPDDFGGRQLLFGFCSMERRFCACDIDARPPVILQVWEEAYPREWCKRTGYMMLYKPVELAYFGGGRFCISRQIIVENGNATKPSQFALSLMAVEVTRELQLLKWKIRCYLMTPSAELGYLL